MQQPSQSNDEQASMNNNQQMSMKDSQQMSMNDSQQTSMNNGQQTSTNSNQQTSTNKNQQTNMNESQNTSRKDSSSKKDVTITLWIQRDGDAPNRLNTVGTIDRKTLCRFSESANEALRNSPSKSDFSLIDKTDLSAARTVLDWMKQESESDNDQPDALMPPNSSVIPDGLSIPGTFVETVCLHHACMAFRLVLDLRRLEVRNVLSNLLEIGPLTIQQFAIYHEFLSDDRALCEDVKVATMAFRKAGEQEGEDGVPDWDEIVAYCQEHEIDFPPTTIDLVHSSSEGGTEL